MTQDIDTTTAGGRLVFTILSAIAEFEREIIQERARARECSGGRLLALGPGEQRNGEPM